MIQTRPPFRLPMLALGVSALLHLSAPFFSGFHADGVVLVPVGLVLMMLAFGLSKSWRRLGYLAFLAALVATIRAYVTISPDGPVPAWLLWSVIGTNLITAAALFRILWSDRPGSRSI